MSTPDVAFSDCFSWRDRPAESRRYLLTSAITEVTRFDAAIHQPHIRARDGRPGSVRPLRESIAEQRVSCSRVVDCRDRDGAARRVQDDSALFALGKIDVNLLRD